MADEMDAEALAHQCRGLGLVATASLGPMPDPPKAPDGLPEELKVPHLVKGKLIPDDWNGTWNLWLNKALRLKDAVQADPSKNDLFEGLRAWIPLMMDWSQIIINHQVEQRKTRANVAATEQQQRAERVRQAASAPVIGGAAAEPHDPAVGGVVKVRQFPSKNALDIEHRSYIRELVPRPGGGDIHTRLGEECCVSSEPLAKWIASLNRSHAVQWATNEVKLIIESLLNGRQLGDAPRQMCMDLLIATVTGGLDAQRRENKPFTAIQIPTPLLELLSLINAVWIHNSETGLAGSSLSVDRSLRTIAALGVKSPHFFCQEHAHPELEPCPLYDSICKPAQNTCCGLCREWVNRGRGGSFKPDSHTTEACPHLTRVAVCDMYWGAFAKKHMLPQYESIEWDQACLLYTSDAADE